MAKEYECPYADIEWEGITCKKSGEPCGNVRWCKEQGRVILTENATKCPKRSEKHESEDNRNAGKQKQSENPENDNNRIQSKRGRKRTDN